IAPLKQDDRPLERPACRLEMRIAQASSVTSRQHAGAGIFGSGIIRRLVDDFRHVGLSSLRSVRACDRKGTSQLQRDFTMLKGRKRTAATSGLLTNRGKGRYTRLGLGDFGACPMPVALLIAI